MSTWAEDHKEELKDRPFLGLPNWELENIVRGLSMLSLLNTTEENERLAQAKRELQLRRKKP